MPTDPLDPIADAERPFPVMPHGRHAGDGGVCAAASCDAAAAPPAIEIVALDASFVVVDKPSGLLAVPGRGPDRQDCAALRVRSCWPDAEIVHRLDMATSGLLLFARGPGIQRSLHAAFAARRVHKRYVACVDGLPAGDAGCIELPLAADWPARPRQKVDRASGKPSLTRWRVLERDPLRGVSRLALEPVTGRSHQLRVHLQAIGHPILGDPLYADDRVRGASPRLLLHACRLAFAHPLDARPVVIERAAPF